MKDFVLKIDHLSTHFDTPDGVLKAVDDLSIEIRKGETFALLGESGCGKSMTSLSIMRLVPTPAGRIVSGEVYLGDQELMRLPESKMRGFRGGKIAMIFQEPMTSLNPVMSIGDQILESVYLHQKIKGKAAQDKVVMLLEDVGIADPLMRIKEFPHQLSGGMKQRVMIAIALAGEPELLIADEPTTALDVTIQAQVLSLLKELQQKKGMAILLITHDLGVVSEMADSVAVMYAGQIIETADRSSFFEAPKHPYSQKLFESLPTIEKRNEALTVIQGSVPSLISKFTGCRFVDRCEKVMAHCSKSEPEMISELNDLESNSQVVRCFLYDKNNSSFIRSDKVATNTQYKPVFPSNNVGHPLLQVDQLKVHFPIQKGLFKRTVGFVKAVDDISLSVEKGKTLALVGESGCGKTTIAKSLLQLIQSTSGSVLFDSSDLTQLSGEALRKKRKDFQIIFQDPYSSMNPRMMIFDIIEEGMVALGVEKDKRLREKRVDDLLVQVGLSTDIKYRYPHEFSGGQRQRICIARALAVQPKLVICDEPTSALDVSVQAQILNLLKSLQIEMNLSYLFITHNLSVVAYLADEIAVMYLGRIVEQGPVEVVLEKPKHPYTQALLSAIPVVDAKTKRNVIRLSGDMPSPANPPPGCHFHTRCPKVMAQCKIEYPSVSGIDEEHQVSCYLY